ncbi:PQQ-dependent sugar dehydrogenase [Microbulbifer harenosus]|uniref:Glucose/Sorbosone dehydrogenase domain-containing protein n=1 Tax=Microbulbifer harenosus TaxID=2576840 RepID=A0ABY2UKG2_9GAMM|nr:PQQ-dependent sugar dehydrogenase [Microbulbifer harenosus]TLM78443.1 hypothetical protein FDY93_06575 [Microbulbifer harenosus]
MNLTRKWIIGLLLGLFTASSTATGYQPVPTTCDGPPKLPVGTMPGTCLGLVADASIGAAFVKPRKALEIPQHRQILVTDMGGWNPHRGILWLLEFADDRYSQLLTARKLATGLNLPHDIKLGPDGLIYLGEAHRITRFRVRDDEIADQETAVESLPYSAGDHLHPLTSFVFLPNGDLLVNAGSKTDDCKLSADKQACEEATSVGLRHYRYIPEGNRWESAFSMYATGLRNSMALVVHPSGTILQGENSADFHDPEEPYEEINVIQAGGFYGWPFCFNRTLSAKEVAAGCTRPDYIQPYSLMPPHVAPLDMIYYSADLLPKLKGHLLVSWHGYRVVGNRVVSYPTSPEGLPLLQPSVTFNRDPIPPAQKFTSHAMAPRGGSHADAQHTEVIGQWNQVENLRPEGAPVGLLQLQDGALLIVDDKNRAVLRLSRGEPYMAMENIQAAAAHAIPRVNDVQLAEEPRRVLLTHCAGCHQELQHTPGTLLSPEGRWLQMADGVTLLEHKLTSESGFMPPTGRLDKRDITTILSALSQSD